MQNANGTSTMEYVTTTWREGTGTAAAATGICTTWGKDGNGWLGNAGPDCAWFPTWGWPPTLPCVPSASFPWGAWPRAVGHFFLINFF